MISAIREVCFRVPDNCGMKPFFISCSIKLLERRKAKIEFVRADLIVLNGRTISVVGGLLKFQLHQCSMQRSRTLYHYATVKRTTRGPAGLDPCPF